ncbi:ComEC/Rec2 family competence protein [Spirochaeta isovalerica]|nr:ComEC/Rec2 family competence protein [Spirochaeta isovalerica]
MSLEIRIRPETDLPIFSLALTFSFYIPLYSPFLFLFSPLLFSMKRSSLPLIAGIFSGLLLCGIVEMNQMKSTTGLEINQVDYITVEVKEDSFLSSKGRMIVKGNLIKAEGMLRTECSASGSVLILGSDEWKPLYQGEIVRFRCAVDYLDDARDLAYIAFAEGDPEIGGWSSPLWESRYRLISLFDRGTVSMSGPVRALFLALYRGNSDYLSGELKDNFRRSGVPHLLALSGFHVAIVVLVLTGLVKPLIGAKNASALALPPLFLYLLFAGGSPSLIRAFLMFTLAVIFKFGGKRTGVFELLLLTACLQLFLHPVEGWSLSFQLSYLALAGLILFGKRIQQNLETRLPSFLSMPLSASLGAHLSTALLLVFQFGEIYPVGLVASLIVTPLVLLFMWVSLVFYGMGAAGFPAVLLSLSDRLSLILYRGIESGVSFFAGFPPIDFSRGLNGAVYLSIYAIVVIWLYRSIWRPYGRREKSQFKLRFPDRN